MFQKFKKVGWKQGKGGERKKEKGKYVYIVRVVSRGRAKLWHRK